MKLFNWIIKRKLLIIGFLAVIITSNAQNASYIHNHRTLSSALSEQFGIPSSVILAVAIVESSAGMGKAATKLNNHFGMVGANKMPKGKKGYHSRYKQYGSDEESFFDFCRMVSRKNFYPNLKDSNDPKQWIKALSAAGYSSQPKVWEKRILNTISTNKL